MITDTTGDLLDDDADALVNGVNIGGVMGRSLAVRFKRRFPEMFREFERMARRGELEMGRVHVWATGGDAPRFVVNVPTKRHWRSRAHLADVQDGLAALARAVDEHGITSIAVPALGCGSGGLTWPEVRPLVEAAFAELPEIDVRLYGPRAGAAPAAGGEVRRPAMTSGRAALVTLVDRYAATVPEVTLLEVERLAYFLQEAGHDLRLTFGDGPYGPATDDLRHVLAPLEGTYLAVTGDVSAPASSIGVVEVLPGVAEEAAAVVAASPTLLARIDRVVALARGFESPYGLELLATAHWVTTRDDRVVGDPDRAVALVVDESTRPEGMFTEDQVVAAAGRLETEGWFGPRPRVPASSWA